MSASHPLLLYPRRTIFSSVGIGCVAILLLLLLLWSHNYLSSGNRTVVDFQNVVAGDVTNSGVGGDQRPVLRMAVAAMISPQTTKDYYEDLLRLIGDSVGRRAVFLQRKTYTEVNELVERKEVDVAFVCSGPYVSGHARFGMEILVVPVVDGKKVYYSYILARRDSPITSFEGLKGKKFAFTDPKSNTGCLVPRYMLAQQGHTSATFFADTFFTYAHDNSIKAVAEKLADGAAVDQLIWEFLDATDSTYTRDTKVIAKSPPYGIPPVVVHPDLAPELKKQLRTAFLGLHRNRKSAQILAKLRIERFEVGEDSMYDSVRTMETWQQGRSQAEHQSK